MDSVKPLTCIDQYLHHRSKSFLEGLDALLSQITRLGCHTILPRLLGIWRKRESAYDSNQGLSKLEPGLSIWAQSAIKLGSHGDLARFV